MPKINWSTTVRILIVGVVLSAIAAVVFAGSPEMQVPVVVFVALFTVGAIVLIHLGQETTTKTAEPIIKKYKTLTDADQVKLVEKAERRTGTMNAVTQINVVGLPKDN